MNSTPKRIRRRIIAAALVVGLVPVLAACGSSSGSAEADSATTTPSKNTGSPILLGFANNEGQALSVPGYRYGAEAAVAYINETGGVNGHDLELITCKNDGSPAGSVNCANKFVAQKAVAYVAGSDSGADAALPVLESADTPYVSPIPWGAEQRTNPIAFIFGNGITGVASAEFHEMSLAGIKTLGYLYYNVPAQAGTLGLVKAVGKSLGVEVVPIEVPLANPDWTSIIATAKAQKVDGLVGNFMEDQCTALTKNARAAQFDGPLILGTCSDYLNELGDEAANTYTVSPWYIPSVAHDAPDATRKQLDIYMKYMKQTGHGDDLDSNAPGGFSLIVELAELMKTMAEPVTAPTLMEALKTAKIPGFLTDDIDCTAKDFTMDPTACNAGMLLMRIDLESDGVVRNVVSDGFFDTTPQ